MHIILIVIFSALSIAFFLYKDKIFPDLNAPYRAQYESYQEAPAVIIQKKTIPGARRGRFVAIVQFKDENQEVHKIGRAS